MQRGGEDSLFLCHRTSVCEAGKSSWLQDSGLLDSPSTASASGHLWVLPWLWHVMQSQALSEEHKQELLGWNPSTGVIESERVKFQVIFSYTESSRPAWAKCDLVSNFKNLKHISL